MPHDVNDVRRIANQIFHDEDVLGRIKTVHGPIVTLPGEHAPTHYGPYFLVELHQGAIVSHIKDTANCKIPPTNPGKMFGMGWKAAHRAVVHKALGPKAAEKYDYLRCPMRRDGKRCKNPVTDGAHVKFMHQAFILPTCHPCNMHGNSKAHDDESFVHVTVEAAGALVMGPLRCEERKWGCKYIRTRERQMKGRSRSTARNPGSRAPEHARRRQPEWDDATMDLLERLGHLALRDY